MTWKELKENIISLGFDDDIEDDVLVTSCNRAANIIYKTVVERADAYFIALQGRISPPNKITVDSDENEVINLPEKVIDLLPLLASHYVWLDDDATKAFTYWNEYDDLKTQLLEDCMRPKKAVILGGIRWGN